MNEQIQPEDLHLETYFSLLDSSLSGVPELRPAFDLAAQDHELAGTVFSSYTDLISHMSKLSDSKRHAIQAAKAYMMQSGGSFGTASEVTADEMLTELGSEADRLTSLAEVSSNTGSLYFTPALNELVSRMEGGHRLKLSGRQPSDEDVESRKVIWGHTMITDPLALLNFTISHYMERYFAVALTEHGSQLAQQKDFMLNALIDVVLIDQLGSKRHSEIFKMWSTPKAMGGLGWVTQDRLDSYGMVMTV